MLKRLIVFCFILLMSGTAFAQFRLAPEVGVNFNRQRYKSNANLFEGISYSRMGYNFGILGDWVLNKNLSLQPELIYTYKGGAYKLERPLIAEEGKINLGYLSLPVSLVGKIDVNKAYIFGGVGVYLSKLVFSSHSIDQNNLNVETGPMRIGTDYYTDQVKPWDAGVKFKFGTELKQGYFLSAFYDISTSDINPQLTTMRNKTVGVQFAFIFSLTEEDRYDRFNNFYEF